MEHVELFAHKALSLADHAVLSVTQSARLVMALTSVPVVLMILQKSLLMVAASLSALLELSKLSDLTRPFVSETLTQTTSLSTLTAMKAFLSSR